MFFERVNKHHVFMHAYIHVTMNICIYICIGSYLINLVADSCAHEIERVQQKKKTQNTQVKYLLSYVNLYKVE